MIKPFFLLLLSTYLSLYSSERRDSRASLSEIIVSHSPNYRLDEDVDNYALEQAALLCSKVGKPRMGSFFDVAQDFYKRNNIRPKHPIQLTHSRRMMTIEESDDDYNYSYSPRSRDEEENNTPLLTLIIEQLTQQHELEKQRLLLEKEIADGAHAEWIVDTKRHQEQWEAAQSQTFKTNLMWGTVTITSLFVSIGSWFWG